MHGRPFTRRRRQKRNKSLPATPRDGSSASNYAAIQRLVLRKDAICREPFNRTFATAFTQVAREIRRFDQCIQAGSGRGYIAEVIQRTRISYYFRNSTDAESHNRFSVEHRFKNA